MGQQLRARVKRARRKAYKERRKERLQKAAAKAKK